MLLTWLKQLLTCIAKVKLHSIASELFNFLDTSPDFVTPRGQLSFFHFLMEFYFTLRVGKE